MAAAVIVAISARWPVPLRVRGAVVLNADVHALHAGGGWPSSYEDAACAVAEGRAVADRLPGDHPLVLVGWSEGALLASTVTLAWRRLPGAGAGCRSPVEASGPDLVVGIAGHYGWAAADPPVELVNPLIIEWFGATPAQDSMAWRLGNPYWWLDLGAAMDRPPFALVSADGDAGALTFVAALRAHHVTASLDTVPDEGNLALSQPCGLSGSLVLGHLSRILGLTSGANMSAPQRLGQSPGTT